MNLHREVNLETEICEHLAAHGWLYAQGDAASYDRARALFPADVLAWVQETQPAAWETLTKNHGARAAETLLARLRDQLDQRGTLDVLRHGVELLGLRQPVKLAEFKPALAINPDILARYQANRLRVIRQVHYSLHNENSIDVVLFLNGVPVATAELKTDFTQSVADAVDQYKFDRVPNPKGQAPEPLLSFPRGALVHFAVSNSEVQMTTHLEGAATEFLPFNRGDDGGAGNPVDPASGHRTAYLWEQVWARQSWLEILGRYLIAQRDKKKQITKVIFPRYHQLDVTRKLQAAVLADGPGGKYLVQHSAGSGKTNSIAWTAHFLAELHDASNKKVFDTVLVVSDRNVIDSQLQEAVFDFARTVGVVEVITNKEGSKSGKLAEALSGDKKIVVCTIQTFPYAIEAVRKLAATEGKRFAVIADEAHSSQAGEAASKLKLVLSTEELAELADGGEVSGEDILAAQMSARADDSGITFVAFTATPKNKTMELFGTRPDPTRKPGPDNVPVPFHVYSMRQAIEEKFILDVLQNYTPYSLAFRLAHEGREIRRQGGRAQRRPQEDHGLGAAASVQHRSEGAGRRRALPHLRGASAREQCQGDGRRRQPDRGGALAARHRQVHRGARLQDRHARCVLGRGHRPGVGAGPVHREQPLAQPEPQRPRHPRGVQGGRVSGAARRQQVPDGLRPAAALRDVRRQAAGRHPGRADALAPQPRAPRQGHNLRRRLHQRSGGGAGRVQDVLHDRGARGDDGPEPRVRSPRSKLDATGFYDEFEVDRVVVAELDPRSKQSDLVKAIEPVVDRVVKRYKAAQETLKAATERSDDKAAADAKSELEALVLFKGDMGAYVRLYTFLSQIYDYGSTAIEKRGIFYKRLIPLLEFGREREEIDLSKVRLTHHHLKGHAKAAMPLYGGEAPKLMPLSETGSGAVQEKERARLREIIEKVNTLFEGDLSDQDKLVYVNDVLKGKLLESTTLAQQAANNTKEQFANSPDLQSEIMNAIISALDAHNAMSTQALNSEAVRGGIKDILLNHARLWEELRAKASA